MIPCPVPEYEGVTVERVSSNIYYPDIEILARTPSRCTQLKYKKNNPNTIKVILKFADFKKKLEYDQIAEEAVRNIPFVNGQPFTQKIIDYKITKECFLGIYEYIDAEDLYDYAARRRSEDNPLTVTEAASIIMEVADIMKKLHTLKVVHRNIKLGNILRRKSDGQIFIGDFSFGPMLKGKLFFKATPYVKECIYNINYDTYQSIYSISPYNLIGKVLNTSPAIGREKGSFVDVSNVEPPIPADVAQKIKEMTINDGQGSRPTMKEVYQFAQQLSGKNCMIPQIIFTADKNIQMQAASEITYTDVSMIHPCSEMDDSVFCNYLKILESKKNHPFEKIKINFGGNKLTELSSLALGEAFENMNTSSLRTISIKMNGNYLGSIDSLIKQLKQLTFPVLTKCIFGFNDCGLRISDIRDTWSIANNQFNPNIMCKLQIDFRNNSDDASQLVDKYQIIKKKFKAKINNKQNNLQSDGFLIKYDIGYF